jgi:hypothetical protein
VQLELGLNFMQLIANLDRKFTNLMDLVALIGGATNSYQYDGASWQLETACTGLQQH